MSSSTAAGAAGAPVPVSRTRGSDAHSVPTHGPRKRRAAVSAVRIARTLDGIQVVEERAAAVEEQQKQAEEQRSDAEKPQREPPKRGDEPALGGGCWPEGKKGKHSIARITRTRTGPTHSAVTGSHSKHENNRTKRPKPTRFRVGFGGGCSGGRGPPRGTAALDVGMPWIEVYSVAADDGRLSRSSRPCWSSRLLGTTCPACRCRRSSCT